jgi:Ca-activated chloride channel family protein
MFINPERLYLLLVVILILIMVFVVHRQREQQRRQFSLSWERLTDTLSIARRLHKTFVLLCALSLLTIAMARPYWGKRDVDLSTKSVNIVIAIDTSTSMLTVDPGMQQSRFDQARTIAWDVCDLTPSQDSIGLLVFADDASALSPTTIDKGLVKQLINGLELAGGTTSLHAALSESKILLGNQSSSTPGMLILFTDGGDPPDHLADWGPLAVQRAADEEALAREAVTILLEDKIRVITVGMGTSVPTPVPQSVYNTEPLTYSEGGRTTTVTSVLNENLLATLAIESDGAFFRGYDRRAYEEVLSFVNGIREESGSTSIPIEYERFRIFLILVLFFLILEGFISERRRAVTRVGLKKGARQL